MEKYVISRKGTKIPRIGFGVWQLSSKECYEAVRYALEVGYRLIDTAKIYGNEEAVGKAVRDSGLPREEIFITTKLWNSDQAKARKAFETSLKKLGLDYVDIYLIHYPVPETRMRAYQELEKLVQEGLIRELGVSNYMIHHLEELLSHAEIPPAINQVEMHPWLYQKELAAYCQSKKILVEAYSPLARAQKIKDPALQELARSLGKTPAQILIRWSLEHGFIPLPKSAKKERIIENYSVWNFTLPKEIMDRLDKFHINYHTCWDPTHEP